MLTALSIRDVVLIERLDLVFAPGLTVLTGETGAGKSILLDALGLALGARAEAGLVRNGATQATVTAEFDLPKTHPARALLAEQDITPSDDTLVVRRTLGSDGRSRAFIDDQPVGVGLLKKLGASLIEVHGQFDAHALFDSETHREILDAHGRLTGDVANVANAWGAWKEARDAHQKAKTDADRARAHEQELRDHLETLTALAPKDGEAAKLMAQRATLQHHDLLVQALQAAEAELVGARGAQPAIERARRGLDRAADKVGAPLDSARQALDRAQAELDEAIGALHTIGASLDPADASLEKVDDRLHDLKTHARRHGVEPDALPALVERLQRELALVEGGGAAIDKLAKAEQVARAAYVDAATSLSAKRAAAAKKLDKAVAAELPPLKLEKARFATELDLLPESDWGPNGRERAVFAVATNPGQKLGPLAKIASGGELARFLLALKVVLAGVGSARTLVFDEVDAGVGGATADAVGERLNRLAEQAQVLVVTHSPQVAARGAIHLRVEKGGKTKVATNVVTLDDTGRREEVARMLSGAVVTDEARAQAKRLMNT
ncbi:DNA repair protein RecN [Roseiterribacter gracilis]|uniref:DNA repair protein RecN n=1 Tax=Roseiterribacter gracilis TaxID=2812848 RepID=A0A8S8XD31_9PROT|nr:DNA repair protein RecN [Rhodospirillales bacterium TMPK1]